MISVVVPSKIQCEHFFTCHYKPLKYREDSMKNVRNFLFFPKPSKRPMWFGQNYLKRYKHIVDLLSLHSEPLGTSGTRIDDINVA
jgi:hypothetical protein